jgi:hypothetical protein
MDTDYQTEGTTVADVDHELVSMKVVVNAIDAIEAAIGNLDADGQDAVLRYADSRYARATSEFRPARIERVSKAPAKTKGAKA